MIVSKVARGVRLACCLAITSFFAFALAEPYETFAGSAVCGGEPTTFSIVVNRHGSLSNDDFDDPCRSGTGRCNDSYKLEFDNTQRASGTAHIVKLSSSGKFDSTSYDLKGQAADIPPPGWNRNQNMHYKYIFVAADLASSTENAPEIKLGLHRYTDIYDGEEKVSLSLAGAACQETDAIYRRFYRGDLHRETID